MNSSEALKFFIIQVVADLIMYFAAYSASVIILKDGIQSFGEALLLIFLVHLWLGHWYNGTEKESDAYDEDNMSREEIDEAIKEYTLCKTTFKVVAMTSALIDWGIAYYMIA